ncbi:MAG: diaminopimelate decarboxylase [Deltaproteobacteria bacterium]|jgi:diaminopimelate decarboxylase|nr:diaminopimelate decarboxylase [Deltaproteobacteria bacterium]
MSEIRASYSRSVNFYAGHDPYALIRAYGSPLYVYNEEMLRRRCRDLRELMALPRVGVCYSAKANANPHLLRLIREEGLLVDAMSPGELAMHRLAGFSRDEIFYVCNNVSGEELARAAEACRVVSVDSLSQLEEFGKVAPGSEVMTRLNPGIGAGHHQKVITAGKETKFGINPGDIPRIRSICSRYGLRLVGLNQHVGSLFMEADAFILAARWLLEVAGDFPGLKYIDFGGGFGIPYRKYAGEARLDMRELGRKCTELLGSWAEKTSYAGMFIIEPGRYVAAEAGQILGTVTAVKNNGPTRYVCTDVGFNILPRPMLYGAFHDVEIYREDSGPAPEAGPSADLPQSIVGNICESGDILHKNYSLPPIRQGDLLAFLDAGAYCYSMASTYNQRLRPAEILIRPDGEIRLIRRRETLEDLLLLLP